MEQWRHFHTSGPEKNVYFFNIFSPLLYSGENGIGERSAEEHLEIPKTTCDAYFI
jgi:hypothetical protein